MPHIPASEFLNAHRAQVSEISANLLTISPELDEDGNPIPVKHIPVKLTAIEGLRLIQPYFSTRFMDQVKAVVPLALYLALFQLLILRQVVEDSLLITGGLFAVIIGLMIFMEDLARGLMPFGEIIGSTLPRKKNGNKYLAWAFMEAAHYSAIWNQRIKRYYQRKQAKAHILVAKKAAANKLARACYHMLKRGEAFDVTRAFS